MGGGPSPAPALASTRGLTRARDPAPYVAEFMTICFERPVVHAACAGQGEQSRGGVEAHSTTRSKNQTGNPASDPDPPLDFPNNTGKFLMGLCSHEEIFDSPTKNNLFFSIYL